MRLVGIDPGVTGALSLFNDEGVLIEVTDLPILDGRIWGRELRAILVSLAPDHVMLEATHAMPKNGSKAAFSQGDTHGSIRTAIECADTPFSLVTPARWKKAMSLTQTGLTDAERKEKARELAIAKWPAYRFFDRKKDHNRAEAALIGLYGYKKLA